ncbi:MAG: glycoside hydrolase family 25 protein, partial [Lachnospiraceae bacterium]|nr:glycoside hydrolase family 25 protein [Lachnospiraceae bacterium]
ADIDLLIVSEDEIDKRIEEAQEREMNEDRDDTEHMELLTGLDMAVMGMDISSFNGEIDWEKIKEQGIGFVIIRCGYRGYTSGALVEDACFVRNISEANQAGVRVGVYFFTQAVNEVEAVEEASMVVTLCRDYRVQLPVFIDTETAAHGEGRADGLDVQTRTLVLKAFCETIENAGYRAGVYASKNWFYERVDASQLTDYLTWLAEYKDKPTYEGSFQFWQYTSHGYVNGVTGRVDLNIGNLSLFDLGAMWRGDDEIEPEQEAEAAGEAGAEPDVVPEGGTNPENADAGGGNASENAGGEAGGNAVPPEAGT